MSKKRFTIRKRENEMIIAYSIFSLSIFILLCIFFAVLAYIFTDRINHKSKEIKKLLGAPTTFWVIVLLCSAQYIFG